METNTKPKISKEEYEKRLKEFQKKSKLAYQKSLDRRAYYKAYYKKNKEKLNEYTRWYYKTQIKPYRLNYKEEHWR